MSMLGTEQPTYLDGRVKQSFKDETDINKILKRAQKTGTISHLNKFEGSYADYADFDFFNAQLMLTKGREIFDALPSEIRSEFNQSQAQFFDYVNDPKNSERLGELLPGLAAPGRQNIDLSTDQQDPIAKDDEEKDTEGKKDPGPTIDKKRSSNTDEPKAIKKAKTDEKSPS